MNPLRHIRAMTRRAGAALAIVLLLSAFAARAATVEEAIQVPVHVIDAGRGIDQRVEVTLFVDDTTPAPHPVAVLNHGRSSRAEERARLGRVRLAEAARWFAARGFLVAVPTRIGYGATGGPDLENSGRCGHKDYPRAFDAAAQQVLQVLAAVRRRPGASAERNIVVGQSVGGGTTVAVAAQNPPGVVAAINFAGGSGGNPESSPDHPCEPEAMQATFAAWGRTARVPMLWGYTENDHYWGPANPRLWFQAFRDAGGAAEFVEFPAHGDEGHLLFARFPAVWQPAAAAFLRRQGFAIPEDSR